MDHEKPIKWIDFQAQQLGVSLKQPKGQPERQVYLNTCVIGLINSWYFGMGILPK